MARDIFPLEISLKAIDGGVLDRPTRDLMLSAMAAREEFSVSSTLFWVINVKWLYHPVVQGLGVPQNEKMVGGEF